MIVMNFQNELQITDDCLVSPCRGGIKLVTPTNINEEMKNNLSNIYRSNSSIYFLDTQHRLLHGNQAIVELMNRESFKEVSGRTAHDFWDSMTSNQFWMNDNAAMIDNKMIIAAEEGFRLDDTYIQHLSFKFP